MLSTSDSERLQSHYENHVKDNPVFRNLYEGCVHYDTAVSIDKSILRTILDKYFTIQREKQGVYLVRSGGSTQRPLVFPVDIKENLLQRQILSEKLLQDGLFDTSIVALNLFSYVHMYRSAAILDDLMERCSSTTLAMGSAAEHNITVSVAKTYGANLVMGTPTRLLKLARYLESQKSQLPVKKLLYAGEFLLASQEAYLKEWLAYEQLCSLYGSAETGIWAWNNGSMEKGMFKVLDEIIIEVDEPDDEGFGKLIISNLFRKRFPAFRYKVGDIGRIEYKGDERWLQLKSREEKSFALMANKYFYNDFDTLLKDVSFYQILLSNADENKTLLRFLLVKREGDKRSDVDVLKSCTKSIRETVELEKDAMHLSVELSKTDQLYTDPSSSKTPLIVDKRQ